MQLSHKEVLLEAIHSAGSIIRSHFGGSFGISNKEGINNLVTEVDEEAERKIIEIIQREFPDHTLVTEETGTIDQNSVYKWVIDPIDGTVNFAHAIPICCVSIALVEGETIILGAVYNPIMNELFFAEKGKGAYLNDQRIHVSQKADFEKSCLATGFPYTWHEDIPHPVKTFERFVTKGFAIRRLGSAAIDLCWVACGRFDGYWEYNLNPWDLAAGYLIVEEAGGMVTDFGGETYTIWDRQTLATNGLVHEDMLRLILNEEKL